MGGVLDGVIDLPHEQTNISAKEGCFSSGHVMYGVRCGSTGGPWGRVAPP